MVNLKDSDLPAGLQNPAVALFLLRLHFLCGEIHCFNIIGKLLPSSRSTLEEARKVVIPMIKAVQEAFRRNCRQYLDKDPEEISGWQSLAAKKLKDLQEEIDQLEVSHLK